MTVTHLFALKNCGWCGRPLGGECEIVRVNGEPVSGVHAECWTQAKLDADALARGPRPTILDRIIMAIGVGVVVFCGLVYVAAIIAALVK